MAINTYRGLLARSDADKGEVSVDTDLRARTSEAKVVIEGTHATMAQTVGGLTQVATGWAEITGTITQSDVGTVTQSITGLIKIDVTGTITQTTPTINVDRQRRKCKLTVQNGKVSGSSDLTDFPVLLRKECLPSEMFDSDGPFPAQANGGDIKITLYEDGTTPLPCEVVTFSTDTDPADGYAEIWTKLTLDHDDDTVFYIWYSAVGGSVSQPDADFISDRPSLADGSETIWSDYAYVGHNLLTDSAGNYTPVDTGTVAATNQWGNTTGARDFNSYGDVLRVPVDIHTEGTYVFSIQAWARTRTQGQFKIYSAGDSAGSTWWSVDAWSNDAAIHSQINGSGSYTDGHVDDRVSNVWRKWSSLVTDYNSETNILNGGSTEWIRDSGSDPRPHNNIAFGNMADSSIYGQYPGDICEGRLRFGSDITADWVYTEYANQDDPATFIIDATPTAYDFATPPPGVTGTITLTLPAITQAITDIGPVARISIHPLNAGFQTLEGISTHRFTPSQARLPEDVVFYCPFSDDVGTSPAAITCYTSTAGSPEFDMHTDFWSSYDNGEVIATPGTNPMGYDTCYNPGENEAGGGLSSDTTKGNDLFEDICYGVTTNISLELLFYLGTNSNQGSSWGRPYGWSEYYAIGDGFAAEFSGSSDSGIAFYNYWASGGSRRGTTESSLDLSTWYRVLHMWDLTNGVSSIWLENQNGSGGDSITSLPQIDLASIINATFNQIHDGGTNGNLFMGAPTNRTGDRYNGGINELIIRINTPDIATVTASDPYVVNAEPLL